VGGEVVEVVVGIDDGTPWVENIIIINPLASLFCHMFNQKWHKLHHPQRKRTGNRRWDKPTLLACDSVNESLSLFGEAGHHITIGHGEVVFFLFGDIGLDIAVDPYGLVTLKA